MALLASARGGRASQGRRSGASTPSPGNLVPELLERGDFDLTPPLPRDAIVVGGPRFRDHHNGL